MRERGQLFRPALSSNAGGVPSSKEQEQASSDSRFAQQLLKLLQPCLRCPVASMTEVRRCTLTPLTPPLLPCLLSSVVAPVVAPVVPTPNPTTVAHLIPACAGLLAWAGRVCGAGEPRGASCGSSQPAAHADSPRVSQQPGDCSGTGGLSRVCAPTTPSPLPLALPRRSASRTQTSPQLHGQS